MTHRQPGNFRDNLPNLDQHTVQRYEGYRLTNPAYYWQMIEGLCPEVVMGRIYSGWKIVEDVPHEALSATVWTSVSTLTRPP